MTGLLRKLLRWVWVFLWNLKCFKYSTIQLNVEEITWDRDICVRRVSEDVHVVCWGIHIGRTERSGDIRKLLEHNKCGEGSQGYSHWGGSSDMVWLRWWRHSGKANSQVLTTALVAKQWETKEEKICDLFVTWVLK